MDKVRLLNEIREGMKDLAQEEDRVQAKRDADVGLLLTIQQLAGGDEAGQIARDIHSLYQRIMRRADEAEKEAGG